MIYKFRNTQTDEITEVEMPMKDYAPYRGANNDEDCWERIYEMPQISMGTSTAKSIDPWNRNDFINRTKDMRGNYGDIMDHAKEMSAKRAKESLTGEDPVKRKYFDDYAAKRGGKKHVADLKKTVENKHIKVDL